MTLRTIIILAVVLFGVVASTLAYTSFLVSITPKEIKLRRRNCEARRNIAENRRSGSSHYKDGELEMPQRSAQVYQEAQEGVTDGMRKYVKIYSCGECVNYNRFQDRCELGAGKDEGVADVGDPFFQDCPLGLHEEDES